MSLETVYHLTIRLNGNLVYNESFTTEESARTACTNFFRDDDARLIIGLTPKKSTFGSKPADDVAKFEVALWGDTPVCNWIQPLSAHAPVEPCKE